ncbi:flagellar hook-length control protein FliK [Pseudomonas sp. DNDY-54]|uniref:flagellar hook-length control protein FliK n=1 Tax=Pseudomonas sp. DNDY-54 TaxID=2870860 RepID=UPI001CA3FF7B|nr:flagellar hook-length control protein FliK [Pseudomonas sp. DNDY-54]
MAVSPDLLLNLKAPSAAIKAANASPKAAPQPSRDEPSSFANVYAKERQAKPVERQDAPAKPVRDKPVAEKPSQETAESGGTEKPVTADTGNELPAEPELAESDSLEPEAELDPLLLFGLGGQGTQGDETLPAQPPSGSEFLVGLAQAQTAVGEADANGETALAGQRALEIQTGLQKSPAPVLVLQDELSMGTQESIPTNLLLSDEQLAEDSAEPTLDESFGEVLEMLDAPKDSRTSATDAAINRLSPLTQAIAQQNQVQQAQRPAMVPGQPVNMQQSGWSEAVVDKVMWLSSQNLKSAEIQLDPAELGRMEVRIDMNKDQAQVTFMSPHAGVRDALEGQMQRLRDSFAQQGMTMDVNVSDQSRGWKGDDGGESRNRGVAGGLAGGDEEVIQGTTEIRAGRMGADRGLVDYYA